MRSRLAVVGGALALLGGGAWIGGVAGQRAAGEHAGHGEATTSPGSVVQDPSIPPSGAGARARLESSPRHGEYAVVGAGAGDSVRVWVSYPQRSDRAPVVLVVHEIFGLSSWIRSVADQLAADGFIAIAPDLLTSKNIPVDSAGDPVGEAARAAIQALPRGDVHRQLSAVAEWGMKLPAARASYGIVGFCWGGSTSFLHAVESPALKAAVVFYGSSPESAELAKVGAPVLGLYGGDDARVNQTIPRADSALKALGKVYEPHVFPGAGHGFLRQQEGREGANLRASREAWPLTVAWFRKYL